MRRIGIIVNTANLLAPEALRRVAIDARRLGLQLLADSATCDWAGNGVGEAMGRVSSVRDFKGAAEAVVVLGGDGTLLEAAHALEGVDLPLMGLNIGSLGYLTSVDAAHFSDALQALREDRYRESARITLAARVVRADGTTTGELPRKALNDIVVSRSATARLVHIGLDIDGKSVTTYACDGVIIATSTGSTAYALAAGGPIMLPGTEALSINVICPHALGARPLVIPEKSVITLHCETSGVPFLLALDGQECGHLEYGDRVEILRGGMMVRLALLEDHDQYTVLSHKLGWGGSLEGRVRQDPQRGLNP